MKNLLPFLFCNMLFLAHAPDAGGGGGGPPAKPQEAVAGSKNKPADPPADARAKKQSASLRHTTPHKCYRRAGLILTNQFKPYEVTETQMAILKKDAWVEIGK